MPNRPRPRCPDCDRAMEPVFTKRERGRSFLRVKEVFWCRTCGMVARGRAKTQFV
jgi:RNase P subunit RPR2